MGVTDVESGAVYWTTIIRATVATLLPICFGGFVTWCVLYPSPLIQPSTGDYGDARGLATC